MQAVSRTARGAIMRRRKVCVIEITVSDDADMRWYSCDADRGMSLEEMRAHLVDVLAVIDEQVSRPHLVRVK